LRERLGLSLGFVLWDGSSVPAGHPANAFAIRQSVKTPSILHRSDHSPSSRRLLKFHMSRSGQP